MNWNALSTETWRVVMNDKYLSRRTSSYTKCSWWDKNGNGVACSVVTSPITSKNLLMAA